MTTDRVIAIIPAYNEQGKIGVVVEKVKQQSQWVHCICVIDDGSTDHTAQEAEAAGAEVIRCAKNQGVGAAIRTGMVYGWQHHFTVGVVLSGDDQHNPEELERVLSPILFDKYTFVQGSRYLKGGATVNQSLFRNFTTRVYPLLFWLVTWKACSDVTNGLRAFRLQPIFEDPTIMLDQEWLNRYELEVYLLYKVYTSNRYTIQEVPITIRYHQQLSSTKMIPLLDWWRILRPLIFLKLGVKQ